MVFVWVLYLVIFVLGIAIYWSDCNERKEMAETNAKLLKRLEFLEKNWGGAMDEFIEDHNKDIGKIHRAIASIEAAQQDIDREYCRQMGDCRRDIFNIVQRLDNISADLRVQSALAITAASERGLGVHEMAGLAEIAESKGEAKKAPNTCCGGMVMDDNLFNMYY